MQEVDGWLERFRGFWAPRLEALALEIARGKKPGSESPSRCLAGVGAARELRLGWRRRRGLAVALDEAGADATLDGETLAGALAAVALRFGERIAIHDLGGTITFAELARQVDAVAGAVAASLPGQGQPVAVLAPLDHRFHLAFLGAARAGQIALVLDPEHPEERLRRIIEHAGARAALTTAELAAQARTLVGRDAPVILVEEAVARGLPPGPGPGPAGEDPAYILYTSGTTGTPKGVAHSHANAVNDAVINRADGGITPADRSAIYYPATMGAIRNSLGVLLAGAELHVLPARPLGAAALVEELRRRRITIIQCVPTLLRRIAATTAPDQPLSDVRSVRLIGERAHWSDLDLARGACGPHVRLQISIGSTECSSTFATWVVDEAVRGPSDSMPVGRPVPAIQVRLLDEDGREVADGESGEVVVTARRLALGYWREPELTAAAFGVSAEDPGLRTFATGDVCRRRADGLLEYLGRLDQMLKIRGHRVEPGEVEAALRACAGIADGAVLVRRAPDGRPTALIAYAETTPETTGLLPRHVLAMLSRTLPDYMWPQVVYLEPLPRLSNFKPDRAALERMDAMRSSDQGARKSDPLLDLVCSAFETVVGCSGATGEDDLMSLGGDSLQVVEVLLELEARMGFPVPRAVFRRSRNISELASWLKLRTRKGF